MKYSVIIPVFNKKNHLKRTLTSVFNQTKTDYELIIVDDGSTDGSKEVIHELIKGKKNTFFFQRSMPGPGGYAARNTAVSHAKGDWMAFLDADDEWQPMLLEEFDILIEKFPECKMLATAQHRISSDGVASLDPYSEKSTTLDYVQFTLLSYAQVGSQNMNPIQTSSIALHKDIFTNIQGFPEKRCVRGGDRDTWLRALIQTDLAWSPKPLATYYRDSENMVTKNIEAKLANCRDETYKGIIRNQLLKNKWGLKLATEIKKLSNQEKKSSLKKIVLKGRGQLRDLKHLYFSVDPFFYVSMLFWFLTPGFIRRTLLKIRNSLKN
jgi:succinoglycan biosynthesis protein ExoO